MKCYPFILALCVFALLVKGQTPAKGELEMQIESIAEGNEENETDLLQLAENIQILQSNPVEINFATAEDLEKIPYLNVFQIHNLLQYRQQTGIIFSPYELQAIKGMDPATIQMILPFLRFNTTSSTPDLKLKNILRYGYNDVTLRSGRVIQQRKGFAQNTENGYLGAPYNSLLRYRYRYRQHLAVGLVAQQDAGEPIGAPYQKTGVDFWAGHIALSDYGKLKRLIIGDYQAQFGQGLALWSSLAFGKSAEAIEVKRYARGFLPYTGSEENRFMRGAATTYRLWDNWDISAFVSSNKVDGNRIISDSLLPEEISTLQTTGLHRTESELFDKDANTLNQIGANIHYRGKLFSAGFTAAHYKFRKVIQPGEQLYQKFRFSGNRLTNYALDFNLIYKSLNFFGEVAVDDALNPAGVVGFQSNPADGLYLTLLFRSLSKSYKALYNAPFGESGNYGEHGTYLGIQWQLSRKMLLKTYIDLYEFRWLRFGINGPSKGQDYMVQLESFFSPYFSGYLRLKHEVQQKTVHRESGLSQLSPQSRSTLRLHFGYSVSPELKLASRMEYTFYALEDEQESGYVLFQDVKYYFQKLPLYFIARYAIIDTESYDTRIYAYENDLTFVFSIPPYYGRSSRFYLMAGYDLSRMVDIQIKYGHFRFYDRDEIGSGLNTIEGNTLSEIRAQLRLKF